MGFFTILFSYDGLSACSDILLGLFVCIGLQVCQISIISRSVVQVSYYLYFSLSLSLYIYHIYIYMYVCVCVCVCVCVFVNVGVLEKF